MRLTVASLPAAVLCSSLMAFTVGQSAAGTQSPGQATPIRTTAGAAPVAVIPPDGMPAAETAEPPDDALRHVLAVGRGDTLLQLLTEAEVPPTEANEAISALREVFDPRSLQIGQQVTVLFEPRRGAPHRFLGLEIAPDTVRSVAVARTPADQFQSSQVEKAVERQIAGGEGVIESSLFEAGGAAGVPLSVMTALLQAYAHDVDFQRDLQPGDRFGVLYERLVTEDGADAGTGDLLHATLVLSGRERAIYRFRTRDGRVDYYNPDGESIRRALLRTPVDGARITSGFGMRRHPILGYSKMHKGTDFGAPAGTPVFAAGDGTVEEIGRKGGYGNYIRLRHNGTIGTAYAHLSRFGAGIQRGGRVRQGEVIGYVGSTGRSTGPHLHYEVLNNNRQVNPRSIDLPIGQKLAGRELAAFRDTVRDLDARFRSLRGGMTLVNVPAALAVVPRKPSRACPAGGGC